MKSLIFLIFILISTLWTSASCVTFNCEFDMIDWSVAGNLYTCTKATVSITDEGRELKQVTGQHESGKSDANVEALFISLTNCPFIPTKIETFFPNLLLISFHQTNLKVLTSTDLRPFPMLKYFSSYNNLIESLDGDVFDNNIQLEQVYFGYNQLVNVSLSLLDKLTKLQRAYFHENPCIDFSAETPAEIAQLKQMLIDQCPPKTTTTSTTATTTTSPPTCGLIEEFSVCEKELSYLINLQVAERTNSLVVNINALKSELASMGNLKNENMKQTLEIVALKDDNEATKTQMKELKAHLEVVQRLVVSLSDRLRE